MEATFRNYQGGEWVPQYSREVIDQLRSQVNIVDVISQDVQLKKQGKNLMGHCPFHEDATPSFSVNEEKQYYYCFSCHRSGDVFKFVQELHDLSFTEAVARVADFAHFDLPRVSGPATPQRPKPHAVLYRIHEAAAGFYHQVLVHTQAGRPALDYLTRRGTDSELITAFGLGYAPGKDLLVKYLTSKEYDYQDLRSSGLFVEDQAGQLHDRFANRVMYPLKNANGQVIAFSGRILAKQTPPNTPKYLNSPETPLFNKRKTLFNLDQAKRAARKEGHLVLFEGFMDVIAAFGAGIKTGVASMGTAFTDEQVNVIQQVTDQLVLAYDGDAAGQNAIQRALKLLSDHPLQLSIVQLPAGLDPDEYVQKYGRAKFKDYLTRAAERPTAFALNYLKRGLNLANQGELIAYVGAALREIAKVSEPVAREVYLKQLAETTGLEQASLSSQLQELVANLPGPVHPQSATGAARSGTWNRRPTTVTPPPQIMGRVALAQQRLLQAFLHEPPVRVQLAERPGFHFVDKDYQDLYQAAQQYFREQMDDQFDPAAFIGNLADDHLRALASQIESRPRVDPEASAMVVADCLRVITETAPLDQQIQAKTAALHEATALGDPEQIVRLTVDLVALRQRQQQMKMEDVN